MDIYSVLSENEPFQDKTNKMICAPSEDSDQPGLLCARYVVKGSTFLHVGSEDADLSLHLAHRSFCWFVMKRFKCLQE